MKKWKVILECNGRLEEIIIEAKYYSDAYIGAEIKRPGWTVKSITEIKNE